MRCTPDPLRPGYDRCGQRSATRDTSRDPPCYYCGIALDEQIGRKHAKYILTPQEWRDLTAVCANVLWTRGKSGGADGRLDSLRVWVTREHPYSEPRGRWMVQIMTAGHDELDRRYGKTIRQALARTFKWLTKESVGYLTASVLLRPRPRVSAPPNAAQFP
jgi:hypothetical protein